MPNVYVYHLFMFAVDYLLLRSVWRQSWTSLYRLVLLSALGACAAGVFGMGKGQLVVHGLGWHGSFFLFGTAVLMFRQKIEGRRRIVLPTTMLLLTVVYLVLCIDAILIEPTALVVRHHTIATEKVTCTMRIVFMADFQTDRIGEYERRTLLTAKEQDADLILWGGDYLQAHDRQLEEQLSSAMNQLLKETDLDAPLGVYAVKGNQELGRYYDWKRTFDGTKVFPAERTRSFDVGEIRLTLLDVHASFMPRRLPDRHREGRFRIMVGHCPSYVLGDQDADLLLAGHTHGGQLQIPGFGQLLTMSPGLPRRWGSGVTQLPNGSTLIVTHGTGLERGGAPRVRLFCRPDIWVIDLIPVTEVETD